MTTVTTRVYTADNVAKYFIFLASKLVGNEREGMTNLKLQKILYFAQAYFVSKIGRTLFREKIEAWDYGPVVPSVYGKYKVHKNQPMILEVDSSSIIDSDKKILDRVWESFGGYSASRLVDITHAHAPWKEAFASTESKEISIKALSSYYSPLLNK